VSGMMMFVLGVLAAVVGLVVGDMVSKEIRARLDMVPHRVITLAARRSPTEIRDELQEEWSGELHEILRGSEALPVTRLCKGMWYAIGLLFVAPKIGRSLLGKPSTVTALRHRAGAWPSALSKAAVLQGRWFSFLSVLGFSSLGSVLALLQTLLDPGQDIAVIVRVVAIICAALAGLSVIPYVAFRRLDRRKGRDPRM
jgi:hypothetical protein